ncbi:hypothetical protein [Leisingera aquaemixtae]|uniref:RNA polymerase sigma factor n=1 Tax=Leisingera aquaemixtae TaxID=1396826 RepID=A0A0N7M591_9RHOB|nr:hypothetical protein [Leisingera aquaemixtae]CUI01778.1 RNA polymerase sigma factor [Leisingera aquaemixtae]
MKIKIRYDNLQEAERNSAEEAIGKIREAVESILPRMDPDLQRLEGHIRKASKGHLYGVSLRLHLLSVTLVFRKEATGFADLLAEARHALVRQVRRHLDHLHHFHAWRKQVRRDLFAELKVIEEDAQRRECRDLFFEVIEHHLDVVWSYASRELAYREANGDLPAGALSLRDAVDAILLAGVEAFENRPPNMDIKDWLLQLSIRTLDAQARQIANTKLADAVALDENPPLLSSDPTEADQEFYEFNQPDDAPTLETLIPYPEMESTEEHYAEHEVARFLHSAIAELPSLWRHALVLVHVDELPEEVVVEILGISPVELTDILVDARRYLKARLADRPDAKALRSDAALNVALHNSDFAKPNEDTQELIVSRHRGTSTTDGKPHSAR